MQFRIANRTYSVLIWPRPVVRGGEARQSWHDDAGRRILISCEVPREDRRKLLFHELRHAWTSELGQPADDQESDALSVSTFMDEMLAQYNDQGGDEALIALNPPANVVPPGSSGRPILDRRACAKCRADVMCGSIISDPPAWNETLSCWTIVRGMICDCGAITSWVEQCTESGVPLGYTLPQPPPRLLVGPDARRWWIEHEDVLLSRGTHG